jgi:hypothetical protein
MSRNALASFRRLPLNEDSWIDTFDDRLCHFRNGRQLRHRLCRLRQSTIQTLLEARLETNINPVQIAHCGFNVAPADVGHQLPDIPPARTCPLGKSPA